MFSPHEKNIIKRLVAVFSTMTQLERIMVFGSRARGESSDHSDLDVLLLVNDRGPEVLKCIQILKDRALDDPEDFNYVSVFPLHESKYRTSDSKFLHNIQREGVTIWKRKELNPSK